MSTSSVAKSDTILSKRRLGMAGIAAIVGCALCCTVPLLAAAGLGGGFVATLASVFQPGSELLVGGAVFVGVLGVVALRGRLRRGSRSTEFGLP